MNRASITFLIFCLASCSHSLAQDHATSFENCAAGTFQSTRCEIGDLQVNAGTAEIDNEHAKTGKQCLHLHGGEKTQVTLELNEAILTDGKLTFWAERWTSRGPFEFRIEAKSEGDQWREIYNGDKQVRVGRAFLSHISIPLGDKSIQQIRFTCTSPNKTGILLDDFSFLPALPQKVTKVEVVPMALPALVGRLKPSAILKLKIDTTGSLRPISVNQIAADLSDTTDLSDIESVQLFHGQAEAFTGNETPATEPQQPSEQLTFESEQPLHEGANYFWICCSLKSTANIDHRIAAACTSVTFSHGTIFELDSPASVQNMGVAVRNGGDDGVHTYRIPGLATTNQGTLIGVYDVRNRGGGDLPGDIDVGMSRSTDGGRTWEPMKVIMNMGNDPNFRFDGVGDPTVMVDRKTGTVWAAATWSHGNRSWVGSQPGLEPVDTGQFMLVKSDDDGVTWSEPINITKQIKKSEWCFILQGPGKGITMSDGTIVLPAQYQDPPNPNDKRANRLPHSTFIYSSDHGETWKTAAGAWDDTTESQVVELADGELMINCRYNRESRRVVMTTNDMGKTWDKHQTHIKALIEPRSCMASIINVGRELEWRDISSDFGKNDLLFSNPNSLNGRNHITIKYSRDGGMTWPAEHQLLLDEQRGAGYSCMTMIDSETVGILYEGSQAHMTFQRVKLTDIISPPAKQKTANPAFAAVTDSEPDADSKLKFARVFGDHMVLQANKPIKIWGNSKPDAKLAFSTGKSITLTSANALGNWQVVLPAQKPNVKPQSFSVICGDEKATLKDLLIGEVWLCAGQSNMEWPLSKSENSRQTLGEANDPLIRLMNFHGEVRGGSGVYDAGKMEQLTPEKFSRGTWQVNSAKSAKDFSAVGYYFGKRLRKELDCPIGMINVSIGGTPIESWVDPEELREDPELKKMFDGNWLENPNLDEWCRRRATSNLRRGIAGELLMQSDEFGPNHSFKPGFMYQSGIRPFAGMTIRGGLWYQGESNGDNPARSKQYDAAFPLLVKNWREKFENADLPIGFVQLPAMGRDNWPVFRELQRRSLSRLTNVGMAITIDTGHPTNVHPISKQPVGERLAQWALAKVYEKQIVAMGPIVDATSLVVNKGTAQLDFDFVGKGLVATDAKPLRHFEVAGTDGNYYAATAKIVGKNKIELFSPKVDAPQHVRYAWAAFPDPPVNLFNSAGIPASPFTTEDDFLK